MKNEINSSIKDITIPTRMMRLPINENGFPIPWFVYIDENGKSDFRVIGVGKVPQAIKNNLCWLCGDRLGVWKTFVIGPMCTVNRVSSEPPSHFTCAEYAAMACPFLSKPKMRRNEKDMIDGRSIGGVMLEHNPGVTALWVTRSYQPFVVSNGMLIRIGEPDRVMWYANGRLATHEEVTEAMEKGLPFLREMAEKEGPDAVAELDRAIQASEVRLNESFPEAATLANS